MTTKTPIKKPAIVSICCIVILLIFNHSYAQKNIKDYQYWYSKAEKTDRIKNDSTFFYAKKAEQVATTRCDSIHAVLLRVNSIHYSERYVEAKEESLNILPFLDKHLNRENQACFVWVKSRFLERIFYVEKNLANYPKAFEYLEMNKQWVKQYPQYFPRAYFNLEIQKMDINFKLSNFDKARDILKDLEKIWKAEENKPKDDYREVYIHSNLLQVYLAKFEQDTLNSTYLDSAQFHNQNRHKTLLNLGKDVDYAVMNYALREGNIEFLRKNHEEAIDWFRKAIAIQNRTNLKMELNPHYFMAQSFYELKQADSTLYYAKKTLDFQRTNSTRKVSYIDSGMYQILSKQYKRLGNDSLAFVYAQKALSEVNKKSAEDLGGLKKLSKINMDDATKDLIESKKRKENQILIGLVLFTIILIYGVLQFRRTRLRNEKKFQAILDKLQQQEEVLNTEQEKQSTAIQASHGLKKDIVNTISNGLKKLEEKEYFLSKDCNQVNVAKKLKTNTAYLSKYMNAHYGDNFTSYLNDLRINYAINRLKDEPIFRSYTIQAISEELGYKSANTFTKVFRNTTGILPSYYIKKLTESAREKKGS